MRVIDVDSLGICKAKRELFKIPEYADGWNEALEIIFNTETLDYKDLVPQGEWKVTVLVDTPTMFKTGAPHCSECGKTAPYRTAFCKVRSEDERSRHMTALEYMEKQVHKHQMNYKRESARGVSEEMLNNIKNKISYYEAAVNALKRR